MQYLYSSLYCSFHCVLDLRIVQLQLSSTRLAKIEATGRLVKISRNVCFWHKADIEVALSNVRFWE